MSTTGFLAMLIPFLLAGALVLAGLGVGLFFLIRHLTRRSRAPQSADDQTEKEKEMKRMKIDDL